MFEVVPEVVIVSEQDGVVMVSTCFEVPPDISPRSFLIAVTKSVNTSLHHDTPHSYPLEIMQDGTYVYKKLS